MRYLLIVLFPAVLCAQDFQFVQEWDSINVEILGYQLPVPWTGGYSYTHPALCDLSSDHLFDLYLGCSNGTVKYFKNCGDSMNPEFHLEEDVWMGLDVGGHSGPSFRDLDFDGDYDLIMESGSLNTSIYQNVGTIYSPLLELLIDTLKDQTGAPIDGTYGDFVDIDGDRDLDFFTGEWSLGTIMFYENTGDSTNLSLSLITTNLLGTGLGYFAKVKFCDIDADSDFDLFVGEEYGHVWYIKNDGTPLQYNFANPVYNWQGIDVGDFASPEFCDIDGDGDYDLFIGKDSSSDYTTPGAVHYWENIGSPQTPNFTQVSQSYLTFDAGTTCQSDLCDIDLDGDLDLFFLNNVNLGWMENTGSASSPSFVLQSYNVVEGISAGSMDLGELNADGNPDLVTVLGWTGDVTIWLNDGLFPELSFTPVQFFSVGEIAGSPQIADLDADGDNDLVIGSWGGDLRYYENQGSPQTAHFVEVAQSLPGISNIWTAPFCLRDFDFDGDFDFLIRTYDATDVVYYQNTGGAVQHVF